MYSAQNNSFNPYNDSISHKGNPISLISQMRKLSQGDIKQFTQGDTSSQWWSQANKNLQDDS